MLGSPPSTVIVATFSADAAMVLPLGEGDVPLLHPAIPPAASPPPLLLLLPPQPKVRLSAPNKTTVRNLRTHFLPLY